MTDNVDEFTFSVSGTTGVVYNQHGGRKTNRIGNTKYNI
jgi:hypothetical protein